MTLDEALEVLERTARSQVCQLEPRDCAAIAAAIRADHVEPAPTCAHHWQPTDQDEWLCVFCGGVKRRFEVP